MVEAYWLIGRRIVEEIQNGEQVITSVPKASTDRQFAKNVLHPLGLDSYSTHNAGF
jgi:hypothetical protein